MKFNGNPGRIGNQERNASDGAAYRLGQEAFSELQERAGQLVAWEKAHCEAANRPEIVSCNTRLARANERRKELKDILRLAPPDDLPSLRWRQWFYWAIAFVLIVSSIFFAHLALAPFGLGWDTWAFCLGIGLIAAFWTDQTLEKLQSERVIRAVCVVALTVSLAGLLVMAVLRGDILTLYLNAASTGNTINDPQNAGRVTAFYAHAIPLLQLLMGFLAVGMELGSGMAVFEARKCDLTAYERAVRARRELNDLEEEMIVMLGRRHYLENEPAINEARFCRNFYLGLFDRAKRDSLLAIVLLFGFFAGFTTLPTAQAQLVGGSISQRLSIRRSPRVVVALDLSQSVGVQGYDGTTPYEKNVDGVCNVIDHIAPGSHITVLGITDQSFSWPDILLDAQVPTNRGPLLFQNWIAMAKARLVSQFKPASGLKPRFPNTDIFGALILASDLFEEAKGDRKVLVVFSDMRNSANGIDLEQPGIVPVGEALRRAEHQELFAPLSGAEVYVLGADAEGKSVAYWRSLKTFWVEYFRKAGAVLKGYSVSRNISDIAAPR